MTSCSAAGCGGLEVTVRADPAEIPANGSSSSQITVTSSADDGSSVELETDRGRFDADPASGITSLSLTLAGGKATATLYSDTTPGQAAVRATVYDENGETKSASARVLLVAQQVVSNDIAFDCALVNVGALRVPAPQLAVPCTVEARDAAGSTVDVAALEVSFLAEAGTVDPLPVLDENGNPAFAYRTAGEGEPAETEPLDGEPSRPDDLGGFENNPRDGLVTLVAMVAGAAEGFTDNNGNGLYEPELDETFDDIGEPLLDVDDDGLYAPEAGDRYFDADGNGEYTGPNGVRDIDVVAWSSFKILWSGEPHESRETTRLAPERDSTSIPRGQRKRIDVHLVDQNLNPVAALPGGYDLVSVVVESDGYYAVSPDVTDFPLANERGFTVAADGTIEGGVFAPSTFFLIVENTTPEGEDYPAEDYALTATVYCSAGMVLSGDYFTELEQDEYVITPLLGTLE